VAGRLLEAGAVVDHAMNNGTTPLDIARANGHAVLAAMLRDPRPHFALRWRRRRTLLLCLLRPGAGGPGEEPQPTDTVGGVLLRVRLAALPEQLWNDIFRFL